MESRKNSNLSDASSAKYNIQVGPALWASCAKNRFFFPVPKQLGRNRVLPGNHGFLSFRHWLLVEPLEWNEIRISVDLSSPLTRNRLFFCRILLPNGIIVRFLPRSSNKTDSSYSSFSFRIGSSLVLRSLYSEKDASLHTFYSCLRNRLHAIELCVHRRIETIFRKLDHHRLVEEGKLTQQLIAASALD